MIADFDKKQKEGPSPDKIAFQMAGIIFMVIILVLVIADFKMYQKKKELISQVANYQKKIEGLKKNSQILKEEIANADNVDYLEKIAYEQLGQQKPGERQIIFVEPEKKEEAVVSNNTGNKNPWLGWIGGALQWIKNKF